MTFKRKYMLAAAIAGPVLLLGAAWLLVAPADRSWSREPGHKQVAVVLENGRFRLYRNGQPYYIKGVNVADVRYLQDAKDAGANSIRIYSTENAKPLLDSAARLGMSVFLGLKMEYADKDMNYSDERAVAAQFERIKKEVIRFKDHPALLMWGIGNETNLFFDDRPSRIRARIAICKAINNIAKMIHEIDPNHPTIIPVTGGSTNRVNAFFCNDVDLIGYNSFEPFREQLTKSYWKGPYIVSEFGPKGYWVNKKTEWYNYAEQTSNEKVMFMRQQYRDFSADSVNCLGSYAFMWGYKPEYTSTWFSLYTAQGEQTIMADELKALWLGKHGRTATSIISVLLDNTADTNNIYVKAHSPVAVTFRLSDTLSNNGSLYWEIQPDNVQYLDASYTSSSKQVIDSGTQRIAGCIGNNGHNNRQGSFAVYAPAREGPYRLFLYLRNRQNKVATANACFYVHE